MAVMVAVYLPPGSVSITTSVVVGCSNMGERPAMFNMIESAPESLVLLVKLHLTLARVFWLSASKTGVVGRLGSTNEY